MIITILRIRHDGLIGHKLPSNKDRKTRQLVFLGIAGASLLPPWRLEMRKTKRTERETNDHIVMLEYTAEEAERELTAMHEAKAKADIEAQRDANYLAARTHEQVKRVKAARALIAELDVYTNAGVVKEQAGQIVDILIESARELAFHTWLKSTQEGPDDRCDDDAKAKIVATEMFSDANIEAKAKTIPF
jgi:hypothetical protein